MDATNTVTERVSKTVRVDYGTTAILLISMVEVAQLSPISTTTVRMRVVVVTVNSFRLQVVGTLRVVSRSFADPTERVPVSSGGF